MDTMSFSGKIGLAITFVEFLKKEGLEIILLNL